MNVVPRWRVYPQLGRVWNLPTIVTQTAAALAVAGTSVDGLDAVLLGAGFAAAYVAGIVLNDAFDWEMDSLERPDRPIPAGLVAPAEAFGAGAALLAAGVALITLAGVRRGHPLEGLDGAVAVGSMIVLYDSWHRGNPAAPIVMGACRGLVYVAAALALGGRLPTLALAGAGAMLAHVAGTYVLARGAPPRRAFAALAAGPLLLGLATAHRSAVAVAVVFALAALVGIARTHASSGDRDRATSLLVVGSFLVDATLLAASGHPFLAAFAIAAPPIVRSAKKI